MNSIKDSLTRKIGPLPAWGWLGLLAGGLLWWRKRQASNSSAAASQSNVPFVGPYGQWGGGTIGGGGGGGQGTPSPPTIIVRFPHRHHKRTKKPKPQHKPLSVGGGSGRVDRAKMKRSKSAIRPDSGTHSRADAGSAQVAYGRKVRSRTQAHSDGHADAHPPQRSAGSRHPNSAARHR